ncbi:MAG TPA: BTAD domain-containing putative transcriptional regulator [Longimicrobiales bacterium]|nr:BTAD domain-containing putative transcriptional regulator [Longimicrobiales bacterium]
MHSLKFFGGASIEGEDGPLGGPAARRHRLALLALLAATHPGSLSRDKLVGLLWPKSTSDHARNLLNQAVHAVRKALGPGAIVSAGDELRLAAGAVRCDIVMFREALAAGDPARAVALYSGCFLDGFFLSSAPEFDFWVEQEREGFARAYAQQLEQLAGIAQARSDLAGAVEWWSRLCAQVPHSSRAVLRLMHALEAVGDRAGAIRQAGVHRALLEQEFGADPDPEIVSLAERLRKATVNVPAAAGPVAASTPADTGAAEPDHGHGDDVSLEPMRTASESPVPTAPVRRVAWRAVALAITVIMGTTAFLASIWLREANPQPGAAAEAGVASRRSIAVLPFENLSGNEDDATFASGIHTDLITALSGVSTLTVISRGSVLPYSDRSKPLPQIGAELDVDVLLEGSVRKEGESVRINVQLSDARTGQVLWGNGYERELTIGNIFALQREITERIAASLQVSLVAAERERIGRPPTESLTAYQYYHESSAVLNDTRAANLESERLLRLALAVDSTFAPAWAFLAVNYSWRPLYLGFQATAWDSALVFVERALTADPNLAHGYAALAALTGHQGHLERSVRAARQALQRDPSSSFAMRRLAEAYRERGAFAEALHYHRASVRLSPHALTYRTWLGLTYQHIGERHIAERWYRGVLAVRPDYLSAHMHMAVLFLQVDEPDSAIHYAGRLAFAHPNDTHALMTAAMVGHFLRDPEKVKRHANRAVHLAAGAAVRSVQSTLATTLLAFVHLEAGDRVRADSLFHESLAFLESMIAQGTDAPRWPYEIALIHAARGDSEAAISWLQTAYDRGFRWAWMLEREPMLDPIRADPRFQGILVRMLADVETMQRRVEREDRTAGLR